MIWAHDYTGGVGRCLRCGLTRVQGVGLPCELPEDTENTTPTEQEPT